VSVTVRLGTPEGGHGFFLPMLRFETGKLYRLRVENPSPNDYYFYSAGLACYVPPNRGQFRPPNSQVIGVI